MKLKTNPWTKDGKTYVTYKVGKFNDYKEGLGIEDEIRGTIKFDPSITMAGEKFKSGKVAEFNMGKIVLDVENIDDFENLELNEWGNASFDLPGNATFLNKIKELGKGARIRIFMEEKTYKDKDGKDKQANGFSVEGLDEVPEVQEEVKVNKVKDEVVKAVQEAINDGSLPEDEEIKVTLEDGNKVNMIAKDVLSHKRSF